MTRADCPFRASELHFNNAVSSFRMPPRKRSRLNPVNQKEAESVGKVQTTSDSPSHPEGEREFRCQFCAKSFLRKEHLQRHERLRKFPFISKIYSTDAISDTKEKPFKCPVCSAGFARRYRPLAPIKVTKKLNLTDENYRDLLARHSRLTHEDSVTPRREVEADIVTHGEDHSPCVATPVGPAMHSPSASRIQHPEHSSRISTGSSTDPTITPNYPISIPTASPSIDFEVHHRPSVISSLGSPVTTMGMLPNQHTNSFGDFDSFIDSINGTYDGGISSFYIDQPIFPPPAAPLFPTAESRQQLEGSFPVPSDADRAITSEPPLFDEFTSTLPSFDPSNTSKKRKEPWKVTQQEWDRLLTEVQSFGPIIPHRFLLPSRHTMTRYITTYLTGFHRHLPFIHCPTFSIAGCPIELLFAMSTIGAISAFDTNNAILLFRTSLAICRDRIRQRKEQRHNMVFLAELGEREQDHRFSPLPLAQSLLILMAMATWGNSEAIFDESIEIQNILVNFVRAEKLLDPQVLGDATWEAWIEEEGFRRTVAIIFSFLIFHTIVYDIPPPILNSELHISLPSRESDWEAQTEQEWKEAREKHGSEPHFQSMLTSLFSSQPKKPEAQEHTSSLGNYMLILALIQHIYFLRMEAKRKPHGRQEISAVDVAEVERALGNWQNVWNKDPESFLGPGSPLGPISFNATALLRMAYIRLNVDLGPWRALNTHIPRDVAMSIYQSPPLATSRRLSRAVLYSAHALSIPVKIGVNIVTHNQSFSWSLQHSLCALECAFIISKWLITIQPHVSGGTVDEEDARLYAYILDMVNEAEAGGEMASSSTDLCSRVVRIWSRILSGTAHWNVVRMIGRVLHEYAQILEMRV